MGEEGQKAQTSSCKIHKPWGCMYSKVTVVNITVLCM